MTPFQGFLVAGTASFVGLFLAFHALRSFGAARSDGWAFTCWIGYIVFFMAGGGMLVAAVVNLLIVVGLLS